MITSHCFTARDFVQSGGCCCIPAIAEYFQGGGSGGGGGGSGGGGVGGHCVLWVCVTYCDDVQDAEQTVDAVSWVHLLHHTLLAILK